MRPDTNAREISLSVEGYPPAKDGGCSIFNRNHPHRSRVVALLEKAKQALADSSWDSLEGAPIGLELGIAGTPGKLPGDLDNYLGGVADVLQADRPTKVDLSHLGDLTQTTLYCNDRQVAEVRCFIDRGDTACYRVRVWVL